MKLFSSSPNPTYPHHHEQQQGPLVLKSTTTHNPRPVEDEEFVFEFGPPAQEIQSSIILRSYSGLNTLLV